ncbi:hypothetical protein Hdeb2414_s0003g00103741 [Helianthus debilis subsp. tardiflorus]
MFYLKLLTCYLICSYLFSFDLLSIYVAYELTLDMLYLLYYVLIHVLLSHSLCAILDMLRCAFIFVCLFL